MTGVELLGELTDGDEEARELDDVVSRAREGCAEVDGAREFSGYGGELDV